MILAELLLRKARRHGDRAAIFDGPTLHATYGQWAARSAGLALKFQAAGLQPGERVVIFMHNHPRYLELLWGAWWAGLVVVPVNAKLHCAEAEWIIDNAQARWGFVSSDVVTGPLAGLERQIDIDSTQADELFAPADDPLQVAPRDRTVDDLAWLFYTSGTTGRPKGVMITQRNLVTMALTYVSDVDPIAADDTIVYAAPMSHGAGIYSIPHLMCRCPACRACFTRR